jgi:hypothetical protein
MGPSVSVRPWAAAFAKAEAREMRKSMHAERALFDAQLAEERKVFQEEQRQGRALVHFSAQPEPILIQNSRKAPPVTPPPDTF